MKIFLASVSGLALLHASPVLADALYQNAAAPSVSDRTAATALADIVVTANRSAQQINRVASSVTVITKAELDEDQAVAVPDVLARTAGVSITRNGTIGTVANINIRGAESFHTVLLIDGVKLNDPSTTQGGPNFSNSLIGDVARVEVLRGAQSTLWGSQAIGGVVNIVTAEPTRSLEGNFSAEAGSYGTTHFRSGFGGANERLSWRVAANRYDTDGFSAYGPGTEDDGYSNTSLSGRLNIRLGKDASFDLRALHSDGRSDMDGWDSDSREHANTEELIGYGGLNLALLDGRLRNRVGYAYTDTKRANINPDREIENTTFEARGENRRWDYQGVFAFTDALSVTFGYENERAKMQTRSQPDSPVRSDFSTASADLDSFYAQFQWAAIKGLNLTAGVRHDDHAQFGTHSVAQLAAAWTPNEGKTVLRASWGQGFRAPSLYELYSEYGNAALRPEEVDSWEAGVQHQLLDRANVALTYFTRKGENEIRYYGCSFGTTDPMCNLNGTARWGYYANIQNTEAQGIEVATTISVTKALQLTANYTWTKATNASGTYNGKILVRRPEHLANLAADYSFATGAKAGFAVRYSGKAYVNDANTQSLAPYTLVDLRVSYPLTPQLEAYGRVENLFDEQYEMVKDYGTAGRSLYTGVRLKF